MTDDGWTRRDALRTGAAASSLALVGSAVWVTGTRSAPNPVAPLGVRFPNAGGGILVRVVDSGTTTVDLGARTTWMWVELASGDARRSVWLRVVSDGDRVGVPAGSDRGQFPTAAGVVTRAVSGARFSAICDGIHTTVEFPKGFGKYVLSGSVSDVADAQPPNGLLPPNPAGALVGAEVFDRTFDRRRAYDPFADALDGVATDCSP